MTTMTAKWSPSPAQVAFVESLFKRKFAPGPEASQFWANLRQASSNESLTTFINTMKARPDVKAAYVKPERKPNRTDIATEPGLYRDPSDGTVYRLGKSDSYFGTPPLSVYSNKAVYRRLTPEGRMVTKGKWTRLDARTTRQMLAKSAYVNGPRVLAAWLMDDEQKLEYVIGFCMFCNKGLVDAVSVYNNIGPVCADDRGIVREVPPEA